MKNTNKSIALYAYQIKSIKAGDLAQQRMLVLSDEQIKAGFEWTHEADGDKAIFDHVTRYGNSVETAVDCPYGADGDTLWVRESHRPIAWRFDDAEVLIEYGDGQQIWHNYLSEDEQENNPNDDYLMDILKELSDRKVPTYISRSGEPAYDLSDPNNLPNWRSADVMPQFASRLNVQIKDLYIERIQDIYLYGRNSGLFVPPNIGTLGVNTKADNETVEFLQYPFVNDYFVSASAEFITYWDLVHGKGAWDRNDWVWVVNVGEVTQ